MANSEDLKNKNKHTENASDTKGQTGDEAIEVEVDSYLPVLAGTTELTRTDHSGTIDSLTHYIKQINRYELLSPDQEKALAQALAETGDIEIAKRLVTANLRLVVKIAMEYRHAYSNVMDLIQEGNIGLMKAVSKYDITKGAKLSYYASWWIRSYILKFILDNFRLVKIGTTNDQKKLFYNLMKEKNRLLSMGVEPDTKTISENLGVSEKAVEVMSRRLGPAGGEVSIDKPLNQNETGGNSLLDILSMDDSATGSNTFTGSESGLEDEVAVRQGVEILNEHLGDFLKQLKPRDREIFTKRLLSEIPPSLQAIADEYGVSRERIRQIEQRLMENLKVYMSDFIR